MSEEFSFALASSADAARKILEGAGECRLDEWGLAMQKYRRAKRDFIAALDPDTGRKTIEVEHAPNPAAQYDEMMAALSGKAERTAALDADSAAAQHRMPAAQKKRALCALLRAVDASLLRFAARISLADVASGKIAHPASYSPVSVRAGMTLGRALAAHLRMDAGLSADQASVVVDAIMTAAAIRPRRGRIVLSSNVLDILLVSESAAYTSCHGIDGCHRAGPQQYLYDSHTIVAYYYEGWQLWRGLLLPFKLHRQMVHIDAAAAAAALQRTYPRAMPDAIALAMRREVARLLHRVSGRGDEDDLTWKTATQADSACIHRGAGLAYLDATELYLSLDGGVRPSIRLADSAVCTGCGDALDECNMLVCSQCACPYRCESCQVSLTEEYALIDDDDVVYCQRCYDDVYTYCHGCETDRDASDGALYRGLWYCTDCLDTLYPACAGCGARQDAEEYDGDLCADCSHSECSECSECGGTLEGSGATICPTCAAQQAHRVDLAVRLIRSPLYTRSTDHDRQAITQRWQQASHVDCSAVYLPELIALVTTTHHTEITEIFI